MRTKNRSMRVYSSLSALIVSLGFFKTMGHVQTAYNAGGLPYIKALRLVAYMRRVYVGTHPHQQAPDYLKLS